MFSKFKKYQSIILAVTIFFIIIGNAFAYEETNNINLNDLNI